LKAFIHSTAIVESGVLIGDDSSIWDGVHIRRDTVIGHDCIVGEKTHISYDVRIGNLVKINGFVYICTAVTIEDGVMISAGCIFTNDRFPRAANSEMTALRNSGPDENTLQTLVRSGATLGAGCIVGPGLTVGRFAMAGMGSVVTRSVPDFHLVMGNPARFAGYVCKCGAPFRTEDGTYHCRACSLAYEVKAGEVSELLR
jgi:acetyltransferase-like isoleucine patch superfamily enzyme